MALQPGKRFGRYELVFRLGHGGMAETWRARLLGEAGFTKTVLIKKVLPEYADDYAFTSMLISEARISGTLTHNNIAQVFDFGRVDNEYFLAMEYVDGQPLHGIIHRALHSGFPAVPVAPAAFIGLELCRGLHYAHTRKDESGKPLGVVHRDISPENVLVSYEGQVKIIDFGLAKARELRGFTTEPGVVKGKYLFFSPEQARGEEVDARTDVWATGIVLYEMLCGKLPVEGPEYVVLPKLSQGQFPRPRELNPRVPKELEDIIMGALALRREERYASCHVFGDALARFLVSAAPSFSSMALSYLVQELFREEMRREGRDIHMPASFQQELASWRAEPQAPAPAQPPPAPPATVSESPRLAEPQKPTLLAKWKQWRLAGGAALAVLAVALFFILRSEPQPEPQEAPAVSQPAPQEPPAAAPPTEVAPPAASAKPPVPSPDYDRLLERAGAALSSRRYRAAEGNYRMALKLYPASLEAKEGLGFSLVLGRNSDESYEEAATLLKEVVEGDPMSARAWFALGLALQGLQDEDEAADAYRKTLVLEPSGRFASDARRALSQMGKRER
ncbi:MAG: protein kinase [Myxococcaceae bacterium]|nr:protein kinase [Myxococcaceae bacterium]